MIPVLISKLIVANLALHSSNAFCLLEFESVFQVAAASNKTGVVQQLQDYGTDINADSAACEATFWHATCCAHAVVLRFLIAKGASVKGCGGQSAMPCSAHT